MQVVRQKEVVVRDLSVTSICLNSRGLLSMGHAHHVHWCVILQLCLVVVLLVVLVTLQSGYLHVVNQQGIILEAAETNVVALCLLIVFFVLDLKEKGKLGT